MLSIRGAVMSEYYKMDRNEFPNVFGCHIIYGTSIPIYLDAKYLPNKYPNIFVLEKWCEYEYE